MEIPGLEKIVINIGVGDATQDSKRLEEAVAELTAITGQKPVITKAKKIHCYLQIKRRTGNWLQSNLKRFENVGFLR